MEDADYMARFGGIARLFGVVGLERLRAAHVCVIGVGGVGSWTVEALARSGIGALTLIDADDVCTTNTNRQLPALVDTVGRPKVSVLQERVAQIAPACEVNLIADFYTKGSAHSLLSTNFHYVIDAVDRMSTKAHIIDSCRQRGLNVLTCGAAGGRQDGTQVRVVDLGLAGQDELLRQVRKKLRREHGWEPGIKTRPEPMGVPCVFSPEKPMYPHSDGTCSAEPEAGSSLRMDCASGFGAATFVTGVFGFLAAGEVVRRIAEGHP
jgi:tRNA A37 threonylcarbamoyladenosine dehydratase